MVQYKTEYDELKIKVEKLKRGAGSSLNGPGIGTAGDDPNI